MKILSSLIDSWSVHGMTFHASSYGVWSAVSRNTIRGPLMFFETRSLVVRVMCVVFLTSAVGYAEQSNSLRRVVLYSSGIGYFERSFQVDGEETVDLVFDEHGHWVRPR